MMLADRIRKSREGAKKSQESLAEALGIGKRTLIDYEKGISEPKATTLHHIAEICKVDPYWLLTGKKQNVATTEASQDTYNVEVLSLQASAGTGVENYQVEVIDTVSIPRIFFRTPQNPAALKVIQVVGDSMEPTLRDGSYILVDTAAVDVVDGIYAIIIGSEIFVKRLQFNLDGTIDIISDNPAYETKRYDPSAQGDIPVRVLGRKVLTVQ